MASAAQTAARRRGAASQCSAYFKGRLKPTVAAGNSHVPVVTYHTIAIDGTTIFYREAGPPDGPVVLLLHGWPASSHMFRT